MGITVILVLKVLVFSLVTIIIYNLLKVFVISKIKATLPIKIGAAVVTVGLLIASTLVSTKYKADSWQYYLGMAIVFLAIFITVDLFVGDKNKNKRLKSTGKSDTSMKTRPKAKPNRVKNRKK